jgi:hypothetical protein
MVIPLFVRSAVVAGLINSKARDYPRFVRCRQFICDGRGVALLMVNLQRENWTCHRVSVLYKIALMLSAARSAHRRSIAAASRGAVVSRLSGLVVAVVVVVSVVVPVPAVV